MNDSAIVELYWQRSETAIAETQRKYDSYLTKIAYNILYDIEDSRESVNDTYWNAWNSMPPHRPRILSTYLAKLTRRIAIDSFRRRTRDKRGGGEYALSLEELTECIPAQNATLQEADLRALAQCISRYLRTLPVQQRTLFIGRYFYADSLQEAAACHGMSIPKAKSILHRTRQGLKVHLTKEGYFHDNRTAQ